MEVLAVLAVLVAVAHKEAVLNSPAGQLAV
jgi:hypothetical protein